jgi:hypothetical protein
MKISISDLKTERQWRSATGYDKDRFDKIVPLLERVYLNKYQKSLPERKADALKETAINSIEELLLFTLFSLKADLTYDLLGLVTGMDASNAKRNQDEGISLLQSMLYENGFAPARAFDSVSDFKKHFDKYHTIVIDATELAIQRPADYDEQKENFSGKKKDIP